MSDDILARLDALESRAAITEVVIRYARAIDRREEALLRSCFHADSTHRHGTFDGLSSDFCTHALNIVAGLVLTHHQLERSPSNSMAKRRQRKPISPPTIAWAPSRRPGGCRMRIASPGGAT